MPQVNHGDIVVGRVTFLRQAVKTAEANSVDWPRELLRGFRGMTKQQLEEVKTIGQQVVAAAEEILHPVG
jgi:hypothetical protein